MRNILAGATVSLIASFAAPASSENVGFNLTARVPVTCQVRYQGSGLSKTPNGGILLGQLTEYCNAPSGYQLLVSYTPGTLRGATLIAGEDRVVLSGSGQAVLSRATGPRKRSRPLAAVPGVSGFDTDALRFDVDPI
jgi:hypothetical protein